MHRDRVDAAVVPAAAPARPRFPDAYIINMYVVPEHQGNGIGRLLLDTCLATADEFGIGKFLLHTTDEGRPLYESAGFAANANWLERPPAS